MDEVEPEDELVKILTESGFKIVPLQAIIDAMAEMEEYLKSEAGISQEELDLLLEKIENLVGKEEAMKLDLDEILGWIRAIRNDI